MARELTTKAVKILLGKGYIREKCYRCGEKMKSTKPKTAHINLWEWNTRISQTCECGIQIIHELMYCPEYSLADDPVLMFFSSVKYRRNDTVLPNRRFLQ